jgi:DNA polymerase-3 subunit delta
LFASTRCLVVTGLENVETSVADEICTYAARPEADVCLVLVHSGGQKGTAVLNRLRKLPAVTEAKFDRLKEREIPGFVASEAHSHGSKIDPEAAADLVAAVGPDLRALAAAVDQLVSDHPEQLLTSTVVRNYFGGRAEVKGYVISDLAFAGRAEEALGELRWAFGAGTPPVLIVGSFASTARTLARLLGAPRGMRDADLAREIGAPAWKLRQLRSLARGWDPVRMAGAISAIARADAEVKGEAADKSYALERMVLTVSTGHA